jgi:hypothetical protein
MHSEIKSTQIGVRHIYIELDGSAVAGGTAVSDGLTHGQNDVTVTENSPGDYTFNILNPGQRILSVQATPITDVSTCRVVSASKTAVRIEQVGADQTTPLADADFYCLIVLATSSAET